MKDVVNEKTGFEKYVNTCFVDIEHSIPRFQQEFFDLQNEYYKMWKNNIQTNIALQKEFTKKMGLTMKTPQPYQKIIESGIEESMKISLLRNQIYKIWIDAAKKNIKIINNNSESLIENWKQMMDFWTSPSKKK